MAAALSPTRLRIALAALAALVLAAGPLCAVDPVFDDTPAPKPSAPVTRPSAPAPKRKPRPRPPRRPETAQEISVPVRSAPPPPAPDPVKVDWEANGASLDSRAFSAARAEVGASKLDSRGRNSAEVSQKYARLSAACTDLLRQIRARRPRTELVRYYLDLYGRALEQMAPPTQRFGSLIAARDWKALEREADGVATQLKAAAALTDQANEYFTRVVQPHLR